jgi:trigger factor
MQITIEDISPVEKRVDFEVPWADVAPRLHTAYEKLRREVHLKGFRPGKVPRQVI